MESQRNRYFEWVNIEAAVVVTDVDEKSLFVS